MKRNSGRKIRQTERWHHAGSPLFYFLAPLTEAATFNSPTESREIVSKMVKGGDNHPPEKLTIVCQRKSNSGPNLPVLAMERAKLDAG